MESAVYTVLEKDAILLPLTSHMQNELSAP